MSKTQNRYAALIAQIFVAHYQPGMGEFAFEREELSVTASDISTDDLRRYGIGD